MKTTLHTLVLMAVILISNVSYAQLTLTTATADAYNTNINGVSFQQDALVTYNGYQYLVYWSSNRHVSLARRALPDGAWQSFELTDFQFQTSDAHYDISLGISPRDGTLHLSFDQWSSDFRYRKSISGVASNPQNSAWTSQIFLPTQNHLTGTPLTPTTYPRFVSSPSGKLLLLLRHGISGSGDSFLYEYDGNSGRWTGLGKFMDGLATDVSAYFNGIHYDANGRLHVTWTWRETPNASSNHDLHYAYSDDEGRNWFGNNGEQLGTTGSRPISENTEGIRVWAIGENRGLINQESQAVDSEGRVSMLMSHMRDGSPEQTDFREARIRSYVYHFMRAADGQWSRRELPGSSFSYDRNKLVADTAGNLYAVINRDGIYRATAANNWNDWQLLQALTDQSLYAEVQIDRQRLLHDGVLSFANLATRGKMLVFDYVDTGASAATVTGGGPLGYRFCAEEGATCSFTGPRDVAFGANGRFYHQNANGPVVCNSATFGEPIRGSVKRCYLALSAGVAPVNYASCADEGGQCRVAGLEQVAYGGGGKFHYRLTQDTIDCNNAEFGDPSPQVAKKCYRLAGNDGAPSSASSASSSTSSSTSSSSSSTSSSSSSSSSSSGSGGSGGGLDREIILLLILLAVSGCRRA